MGILRLRSTVGFVLGFAVLVEKSMWNKQLAWRFHSGISLAQNCLWSWWCLSFSFIMCITHQRLAISCYYSWLWGSSIQTCWLGEWSRQTQLNSGEWITITQLQNINSHGHGSIPPRTISSGKNSMNMYKYQFQGDEDPASLQTHQG